MANLYNQIDFSNSFTAPGTTALGLTYNSPNRTTLAKRIPTWQCPSGVSPVDTYFAQFSTGTASGGKAIQGTGVGDYGCVNFYRGVEQAARAQGANQFGPDGSGPLAVGDTRRNFAYVTDGLSNTIILSEQAGRIDRFHRGVKVGSAVILDGSLGYTIDQTSGGTVPPLPYTKNQVNTGGGWADVGNWENWQQGSNYDGTDGTVPNFPPGGSKSGGLCFLNCTSFKGRNWYSFHPGGVHVLLLDGSVRFMGDNTSLVTIYYLCSPQGGQPPGDF